jgi:hypothetical protein
VEAEEPTLLEAITKQLVKTHKASCVLQNSDLANVGM